MTDRRNLKNRFTTVAALLVLASCTAAKPGADSAPSGAAETSETTSVLDDRWTTEYPGVVTTMLTVPVDYDDPSQGTLDLFVARRLAPDPSKRIGALLVNPGGPGFGGSYMALEAERVFSDVLLERFDIVGFDPRGTGRSTPAIDCVEDYDAALSLDPTPDDQTEMDAHRLEAEKFVATCNETLDGMAMRFSTNNTARDMDSIRKLLGEETISYFGMSYGSELGAVWATLFPQTVRAAVLDGAVDPNADSDQSVLQQVTAFNTSVESFLEDCSADAACPLNDTGDPKAEFLRIRDAIAAEPIAGPEGRPDVNFAVWQTAVVFAMYSDAIWPELQQALADARSGDGSRLMSLYDSYMQRRPDGTWGNELEAFTVINCADDSDRQGLERTSKLLGELIEVAPLIQLPDEFPGYGCSLFDPAVDPRVEITGAGAGPILVVGTTGDAATPLASTERMAAALEQGVLLVVEANRHGGYGAGPCGDRYIHQYLIDLTLPASGTRCQ